MFLFRRDFKDHLRDGEGRTPLSHAVEGGHEEVVIMFLTRSDIEPNFKDDHGRTPLLYAAEKGHEAVVKLLLEYRADANSKDKDGRTPLLWAAMNRNEATVKLLLETGKVEVLNRLPYAENAPYNSYARQHEPTCFPDTRVDVLYDGRYFCSFPKYL